MARHTRRLLDSLVVALGQRTAIGTRNLHNWSLPAATPLRSSSHGCLSDSSGYHASPYDPLRAATGGCASTSLRGDHRAQSGALASDHFRSASSVNCVASRSFASNSLNRKAMTKGQKASSVMHRMNQGAMTKFQQTANVISPGMLMGYWDPVIIKPAKWISFPSWLWNHWRPWALELVRAAEACKVLTELYGTKEYELLLQKSFAETYVKIKQQIASGKPSGRGNALTDFVLPVACKHITAEMARRRQQGVTSITWMLKEPMLPLKDVTIAQTRLLMATADYTGPAWFQVVVQFDTKEIMAGYGSDGRVLLGHPEKVVDRQELWVMERNGSLKGDSQWRLAARLSPPGGEVRELIPSEEIQKRTDALWESVKLAQKNSLSGWVLNTILDPPGTKPKRHTLKP